MTTCCKASVVPPQPQRPRQSGSSGRCERSADSKHWTAVSATDDSSQMSPSKLFSAITIHSKNTPKKHRICPTPGLFFLIPSYFWFKWSLKSENFVSTHVSEGLVWYGADAFVVRLWETHAALSGLQERAYVSPPFSPTLSLHPSFRHLTTDWREEERMTDA